MKKLFIFLIILIVLTIIGTAAGYFYYDKYIRYGRPLNIKDMPASDGFHFENALREKSFIFWNYNGNFQVVSDIFSDNESALKSYNSKLKLYEDMVELNGLIITEEKIYGKSGFVVKSSDGSWRPTAYIKNNNRLLQIYSHDRSEPELKKFTKRYILYWDNWIWK